MTYRDNEISIRGGKPVELFEFVGTYESFYYTSGAVAQDYAGHTYVPVPIQRTAVSAGTQDDDNLELTIEMPVSLDIVQKYGFQTTPPKLVLTIHRFHTIDSVVPYWHGPVDNIASNDGIATFRCPSTLGQALNTTIPHVYYQSPCNRILFDKRCRVVESVWTFATTVTAVAGRVIAVASVGTLDGKLIGGDLRLPSGERRMITAQSGLAVTVNFPFSAATVGQATTLAAGCDHAYLGDCATKFNNQKNFGGFPFIPAENPFSVGVDQPGPLADNTCHPPLSFDLGPTVEFYLGWPSFTDHLASWQLGGPYVGVQPHPPYGVVFGRYNRGYGDNFVIYENNNPSVDPRLHGQKLLEVTTRDGILTFDFTVTVPRGDWHMQIQYNYGAFGGAGHEATFKIFQSFAFVNLTELGPLYGGGRAQYADTVISGLFPYDFYWTA